MALLEKLDHPPREYTAIPFWFLNGDLDHGEIRRQLKDFCGHGVYGVVLHPRIGLSGRIGYLSPAFFSYIRTAIESAKELDMRVVLYDEGMYPSGSACGQVVAGHPEWASRGLALTDEPLPEDTVLCRTDKGILVERFSGGTIRGIHFGEDDGEPNAPPSADILNPDAVEKFIALTHEAYWREFAPYFGSTVIGFFTDEPSILGRNTRGLQPWTMGFAEIFTRAGGSLAGLTALFTGEENDDTDLYRRLILQREGEVYYARLSRWCENHGVFLMGHPHQSDDIEVQRYFHVPGQDLVFRWVSPEKGGTLGMDSVMGKCSADMAYHLGRKRNSNECFGACSRECNPWHFTGADMKWYIDWLAVRGVNLYIPHAFYYSLEGKRCQERPPDVGPGSIWWPHYRKWAEYMARLSCLMAEAETQAEIAVLCRNREMKPEAVAPLYMQQKGFRYVPESLWADCREKDGVLVLNGKAYQAVLGPEDMFPSVSHDVSSVPPDCVCWPPAPTLRTARLCFDEREGWLLVNEGESEIHTALTLPTDALIGGYDLWNGRTVRIDSEQSAGERTIDLRLDIRESLLLFTCKTREEWEALPEERPFRIVYPDAFTLEIEMSQTIQKTYTAKVEVPPGDDRDLLICVHAEEMAELYANGKFCGAAFWPPQKIRVKRDALRDGINDLRLAITGSLANRYGIKPVWYGLKKEEG